MDDGYRQRKHRKLNAWAWNERIRPNKNQKHSRTYFNFSNFPTIQKDVRKTSINRLHTMHEQQRKTRWICVDELIIRLNWWLFEWENDGVSLLQCNNPFSFGASAQEVRIADTLVANDLLLCARIAQSDDYPFGSTSESEINYTRFECNTKHSACGEHTMGKSIWIEINSGNVFNCYGARTDCISFRFDLRLAWRANDFSCFTFTTIWNWCMARVVIDLFMHGCYCALSTAGALPFLFVRHSQVNLRIYCRILI